MSEIVIRLLKSQISGPGIIYHLSRFARSANIFQNFQIVQDTVTLGTAHLLPSY